MLGDGELGDRVPLIGGGKLVRPKGVSFGAGNDALAPFLYFLAYFIGVRFLGAQGIIFGRPFGRLDSAIMRAILSMPEKVVAAD
jgi:predicted PurR-regulated permease PerM